MKKLVSLMLVALIGTVASAGIMYSGANTIALNSTGTISIIADVAAQSMNVGAIALNKGSAKIGTLDAAFSTVNQPGVQKDGTKNGIWIFQVNATAPSGTTVAAGQSLYTFTIDPTGLAVGDVITISQWTGTNPFGGAGFPVNTKFNGQSATLGSFDVTVVPEPITVALLGLGGLFIRRRK